MEAQQREHSFEESGGTVRRLFDSARDIGERAGAYARARINGASERAETLARDASDVAESTGARIEATSREMRRFLRNHPLKAIAITIAAGYILGRILTRG